MSVIVKGLLSGVRICPKCGNGLVKDRGDQPLICPCGWVWEADNVSASPTNQIGNMSASIHGKSV